MEGLMELKRASRRHPNQTSREMESAVIDLRQSHMQWGPRKLKRVLDRDQGWRPWPATSTIGEIIRRAGLVVPRKKRRRTEVYTQPLSHADGSNRVWSADFKGWFKASDGARIDPLTISDAWSRYLLRCQAVEKTDTERVRAIFEAAFREYGMPEVIRTDNGSPFASSAVGGLSRLSVWWIKLGIVAERIEAGHPEQNGRHERMHRSLKLEVRQAEDWRSQQRELDRFCREYNRERPHEALKMQTPASVYEPSLRPYPARIAEIEYPDSMEVRPIKRRGQFRWKGQEVFLTEVLWGERIGLLEVDDGKFDVYFANLPIARLDRRSCKLVPRTNCDRANSASFGSGQACPDPNDKNKNLPRKGKVSGMRPV